MNIVEDEYKWYVIDPKHYPLLGLDSVMGTVMVRYDTLLSDRIEFRYNIEDQYTSERIGSFNKLSEESVRMLVESRHNDSGLYKI